MTVNIQDIESDTLATSLDVMALYRTMLTARVMNDLLKTRKTQGKYPFYIGCAGHESMAAVIAALNETDWLALYYRDLAAWLQRTGDTYGPLREAYSRVTGPMNAGRNMPAHYSGRALRILPGVSEVAGLCPFAGGVGFSIQRERSDELVLCSTGDGGVATNDFNVLFRQASVHQLPVLMVVEDNSWAITMSGGQWAGSLVEWSRAGGVYAEEVDGSNVIATYESACRLVQHIRSGKGPALMHLRVGLLDAHSSSTDIKSYRKKEEIELTVATKDPVQNFGRWLIENGSLQESDIARMRKEIRADLERIEKEILLEPVPTADRVMNHQINVPIWQENTPRGALRPLTMLGAINEALVELAQRDPDFFVYGQDVGSPKGGVFGATASLVKQHPQQVISSPLNEQMIIGIVSGASMRAGKARCAEIQFVDYHQSATQTIRLAARFPYQTYGDWNSPLLIRTKSGSGGGGPISSSSAAGGGAFGHSNAGEQWFTNVPGLITVCPSTPFDAKGLLLESARAQSPVMFLERGRLYRSEPPKDAEGTAIQVMADYWHVPDGYYTLPLGKARRLRIGDGPVQVAIIAWGTMVLEACTAAANMVKHVDGAIEIVDLRTLIPFDQKAITAAVKEASRVIVVTEEIDLTSFGRHIHSWIVQNCFYDLDATPVLLSALAAPAAPYSTAEETAFYPSAATIETSIEDLLVE
ncbi:MAG TPA: thiamine pyrophosphate-dependent enzyme [Dictyobacter sp.]|nr:thiamine pyrophosphate-dependent enzyme [Dictyobacter sp.]